jgi:hypothetical protein
MAAGAFLALKIAETSSDGRLRVRKPFSLDQGVLEVKSMSLS